MDIELSEVWMDENGMRTCPRCRTTFDGTTIRATKYARILCADCTLRSLDERRAADRKRIRIVR